MKDNRIERLTIKLTTEEKQTIKDMAKEYNCNMSNFIRIKILNKSL